MFQLDFLDPTRSHWTIKKKFRLLARKKKPAHGVLASLRHPLRILELCCGPNASFYNQILERFPDAHVVTLDINAAYSPTIVADIKKWHYRDHYELGFFHMVWASPPCTGYSPANKATSPQVIQEADDIAQATLRALSAAKAPVWFLENPHTQLNK